MYYFFIKTIDKQEFIYYNTIRKRKKGCKKMMTVREMMEFLAEFDEDAEVILCDWDDVQAVRIYQQDELEGEKRWNLKVEDE